MRRQEIRPCAAALVAAGWFLLAALFVALPAAAGDDLPAAPWEGFEVASIPATKSFPPVVPKLATRPTILLETGFNVYGPGTGFDTPKLVLTMGGASYNKAATLYLYWQDRVTGDTLYYSLRTRDFGSQPRDLFGVPGAPAKVRVPTLDEFPLFGPDSALGAVPASIPATTGAYQFVFEVREVNNAGNETGRVVSRGNAMYNHVDGVVQKSGNINSSETWTRNNAYYVATPVNVFSPAVLTIEAGTVVLGGKAGQGTLIIRQGAKINAIGTSDLPIIMTSELEVGQRSRGDWGGLVVNGFAPTNQQNPTGEGNSGPYGGNNPADNSGTLRYLRVEWAGILFSDQNELNGIAFQGVGSGTTVDHIQIHQGLDDGIEFFGGTVQLKYVLITDAYDDSFDWTFGWAGKAQHVVAIQRTGDEDHCIEADNDENDNDGLPRSHPKIANATFVGNAGLPQRVNSECILLRRGTGADLSHVIQLDSPKEGVKLTEDATIALIGTEITFTDSVIDAATNGSLTNVQAMADYLEAGGQGNDFGSANLPKPQSVVQPDVAPVSGPALDMGPLPAVFLNDPFFDNVTYAGGVNPNDPWIDDGWTTFSDN